MSRLIYGLAILVIALLSNFSYRSYWIVRTSGRLMQVDVKSLLIVCLLGEFMLNNCFMYVRKVQYLLSLQSIVRSRRREGASRRVGQLIGIPCMSDAGLIGDVDRKVRAMLEALSIVKFRWRCDEIFLKLCSTKIIIPFRLLIVQKPFTIVLMRQL